MTSARLTPQLLEAIWTTDTQQSFENKEGRRSCFVRTIRSMLQQDVFQHAFKIALPCGLVAGGIKIMDLHAPDDNADFLAKLGGTEIYSSCTFLIGMLLIFRTFEAYGRYWDGVDAAYGMMADFLDVFSKCISFCKPSKVDVVQVSSFQHVLVRLMSLLHALILTDLESFCCRSGSERSLTFEFIDIQALDTRTLIYIQQSSNKVELVSQWIKALLVDAIDKSILDVPTSVSERLFQELASGQHNYYKALKIAATEFPFPYTATSQLCLLLHWCVTPFVVGTWTNYSWYSAVLTFIQVFILWSLDSIALELENPFEQDLNDLDVHSLHKDFNARLLMLLEPASRHYPKLTKKSMLSRSQSLRAVFAQNLSCDDEVSSSYSEDEEEKLGSPEDAEVDVQELVLSSEIINKANTWKIDRCHRLQLCL